VEAASDELAQDDGDLASRTVFRQDAKGDRTHLIVAAPFSIVPTFASPTSTDCSPEPALSRAG
jgi:hypothetical protein